MAYDIGGMILVLEGIGSLPDALLTNLAHDLWWSGRRERATCSATSKTWEKTRLAAAYSYPYRSPLTTCQVGPRQFPNIQSAGRPPCKVRITLSRMFAAVQKYLQNDLFSPVMSRDCSRRLVY
jgi:hypothetical protein